MNPNNEREHLNDSTPKSQASAQRTGEFSGTAHLSIEQVKAPALSLPKGGGAMRSIDEKFSVNSANGTLSFSIPLPLTPGRGGTAPALSLQYNAGSGNSIFGLGWNVDYPAIQRKTDKQLPRYAIAGEADTYMFSGVEDLVPVLLQQPDGSWEADEKTVENFHIKKYRPRIEGSFSLIERIQPAGAAFFYWKVTTGANVVTFYGKSDAYRISDPASPEKIFKWLPECSFDDKGNCTVFEFKAEDLSSVAPALHEKNRLSGAALFSNKYLKRIKYGNREAFYPAYITGPETADALYNTTLPADLSFLFEAVFDFGEHTGNRPAEDAGLKWSARTDPFSDYRAGFEMRTYRICNRVLMFHNFEELGNDPCLVQSLDLTYQPAEDITYLTALTSRGYIRQSGTYQSMATPPVEFGYQGTEWDRNIKALSPESSANLPVGLSGGYQWIDLFGEGIAGIFTENGNTWYYKSNEGNGVFSAAMPVATKPTLVGIQDNTISLQDLEANGQKQLVVHQPGLSGYYQLTTDGQHTPFQAFKGMPDIDLNDPNVKLLDVNGDGQPDLLVSEEQAFRWYPAKGKLGYDAPELAPKSFDEEQGPAIVFADSTQSILLADMSGDGLTDIVRIRNGEVCYWPNIGYGKFGAKVTMSESPLFDSEEQFNPAYLRLADINGSGATDICYLGKGRCNIWLNQGGNAWGSVIEINPFPDTALPGQLAVVDLLGNGTACLVWSSPLPQLSATPLQYIDLMGGKKPHVLNCYKNNRGKEVNVEYLSSTAFYLEDKKAGRPWATRLPFPVQCVSKVITTDKISGTRFTGSYRYHHGCYDHTEREFRGFALVEVTDTEAYDDYRANTAGSPSQTDEALLYQPPVTTKTWYHTGVYLGKDKTAHQLQQEYYPLELQQQWVVEDDLPAALSTAEFMEACRALKGHPLHQEVYSYDNSDVQQHPYSITHYQYQVSLLQQRDSNRYAVFLAHEKASMVFHLERNPQDPRIVQHINVLIDEWGNVKESAAIVYGRKMPDLTLPTNADREQQSRHHIVYTKNDFTLPLVTSQAYCLPAAYQARVYELKAPLPAAGFYTASGISSAFTDATEKQYQHTLGMAEKKKIAHTRNYFMKNDLSGPLPLGEAASLRLPWQSYQLAFTPQLVAALYGNKVTDALLRQEGGYVQLEGDQHYWVASGRSLPYPGNTVDLAFAKANFYLPVVFEDNRGNPTKIFYDKYRLHPQQTIDAAANESLILAFNYRTLTASVLQDLNGNRSGIRQDALGRVTSTFLMGKAGENRGDLMDTGSLEASTGDQPGSRLTYEFRYYATDGVLPDRTIVAVREQHYYTEPEIAAKSSFWDKIKAFFGGNAGKEPIPEAAAVWQTVYTYSDGSGHEVLTKAQAAPGMAPERDAKGQLIFSNSELQYKDTGTALRWLGNGRVVYNNKGKAVKQYEPFFDCIPEYNNEQELVSLGFTPVLFYDAVGRLQRTELQDGTITSTTFDAWTERKYDQNDNVLNSRWYQERIDGQKGEAARVAAQQAALHDNTPMVSYIDGLGRSFLSLAHNKALYTANGTVEESLLYTRTTFDIAGNVLTIKDARNNEVVHYSYNLTGISCFQHSMDTGDSWLLKDVTDKDILKWDSQQTFSYTYDTLHRLIASKIQDAGGEKTFEKIVYGETLQPGDPAASNLRGKVFKHFDTAGVVIMDTYDFKGNLSLSVRRLLKTYKGIPDWQNNPALENETFEEITHYDALNRSVMQITPDGSIITPTYNAANQLNAVKVNLQGKAQKTTFISNISYNAKGQREAIYYGNNTVTRYTCEPETYRLIRLLTTANNGVQVLQDLQYTYDPVGNIARIFDDAQKTVFYGGQKVSVQNTFVYDALYRLIIATGREHSGQLNVGAGDNWEDDWCRQQLQPNAQMQLREYQQKFRYDAAGNMLEQQHIAGAGSWTRTFGYDTGSNRLSQTQTGNRSFAYQYNARGSMLNMPHLTLMDWNCNEELCHAGLGGGGDAWYVYDSEGSRVRKVIERPDGTREERIYLGAFEIYRKGKNNNVTLERETLHVMDDHQRIAMVETRTKGNEDAPKQLQRYQYNNHLQTSCLELDETARIISYEEYHPFGTTAYQAVNKDLKASLKRYRYTGKERDEESGLYYHGARYYAPWICRWTAADPETIIDGLNIYQYVRNNPVAFSDPTGTLTWGQWAGIGAAVVVGTVVTVATAGLAGPVVGTAAAAVIGGIAGGAAGSVVGEGVEAHIDKREAHYGRAAVIGAATGGVFAGGGAAISAIARTTLAKTAATAIASSALGRAVSSGVSRVIASGAGRTITSAATSVARSQGAAMAKVAARAVGRTADRFIRQPMQSLGAGIARKIPGSALNRAEQQALANAAATQLNTAGVQGLQRSITPAGNRTFIHTTMRGNLGGSNAARKIMEEGSMNLSAPGGFTGQYGAGVYAYEGRVAGNSMSSLIEFKVPPGTAMETVVVPGQSSPIIRLVPNVGESVPVRITGTNIPKGSGELGKLLAGSRSDFGLPGISGTVSSGGHGAVSGGVARPVDIRLHQN